jgi:hypothetical protein
MYWATIPQNHPLRKYSEVQIYNSHTTLDAIEQHLGFLTDPEWCWDETSTKFSISETSEPDLRVDARWENTDVPEQKITWLKIVG